MFLSELPGRFPVCCPFFGLGEVVRALVKFAGEVVLCDFVLLRFGDACPLDIRVALVFLDGQFAFSVFIILFWVCSSLSCVVSSAPLARPSCSCGLALLLGHFRKVAWGGRSGYLNLSSLTNCFSPSASICATVALFSPTYFSKSTNSSFTFWCVIGFAFSPPLGYVSPCVSFCPICGVRRWLGHGCGLGSILGRRIVPLTGGAK